MNLKKIQLGPSGHSAHGKPLGPGTQGAGLKTHLGLILRKISNFGLAWSGPGTQGSGTQGPGRHWSGTHGSGTQGLGKTLAGKTLVGNARAWEGIGREGTGLGLRQTGASYSENFQISA